MSDKNLPVPQLLDGARRRETEAIAVLYQMYADRLYAYFYYRVADEHTAEDLTENVFGKMIEALPTCRAQTLETFTAWLFQIARRFLINYYRQTQRQPVETLTENIAAADNVEDDIDQGVSLHRLQQALTTLTDEQREVVILKFINGCSNAEIAQVMGKTEDCIKALQYRALSALRRALNSHLDH